MPAYELPDTGTVRATSQGPNDALSEEKAVQSDTERRPASADAVKAMSTSETDVHPSHEAARELVGTPGSRTVKGTDENGPQFPASSWPWTQIAWVPIAASIVPVQLADVRLLAPKAGGDTADIGVPVPEAPWTSRKNSAAAIGDPPVARSSRVPFRATVAGAMNASGTSPRLPGATGGPWRSGGAARVGTAKRTSLFADVWRLKTRSGAPGTRVALCPITFW